MMWVRRGKSRGRNPRFGLGGSWEKEEVSEMEIHLGSD